jgi:hypothetical protein
MNSSNLSRWKSFCLWKKLESQKIGSYLGTSRPMQRSTPWWGKCVEVIKHTLNFNPNLPGYYRSLLVRSLGTPPHGAINKSYCMDGCRRVEGAEQRGGDSWIEKWNYERKENMKIPYIIPCIVCWLILVPEQIWQSEHQALISDGYSWRRIYKNLINHQQLCFLFQENLGVW